MSTDLSLRAPVSGLAQPTEPGAFGFVATDAGEIAWERVQRVSYLIRQQFHYDYPGPISQLKQRLIVIPPERHGDQRLIMHKLEVSSRASEARHEFDRFGGGHRWRH